VDARTDVSLYSANGGGASVSDDRRTLDSAGVLRQIVSRARPRRQRRRLPLMNAAMKRDAAMKREIYSIGPGERRDGDRSGESANSSATANAASMVDRWN
jgi:hypothetical protein